MSYKKSYIQKGTEPAIDLFDAYNIRIKSIPFKPFPDTKEIVKREWYDQHGDDEFIPENMFFKSYEIDVKFTYIGGIDSARDSIFPLLQYMQGNEFCLYDEYSKVGIKCRYDSYSNDAFYRRGSDIIEFSVKLKVNNPLCYGLPILNETFSGKADCDMTIYWGDGTNSVLAKDDNISKTATGLDYAVVVPSKLSSINSSLYSYNPQQFLEGGYMTILSSTGIKYIQI